MPQESKQPVVFIRRRQVEKKIGLGCSAIYARLNPKSQVYDPTFPKPVSLGGNSHNSPVAWVEAEIDAWMAQRIEISRKAA